MGSQRRMHCAMAAGRRMAAMPRLRCLLQLYYVRGRRRQSLLVGMYGRSALATAEIGMVCR